MAASSNSGDDERILSYHDEILRRSDLGILRSRSSFINDRIISFYFTHLSLSLSRSSSSTTLLIPPSLSYLISLCPNDPQILSPLDLPSKTLVLFPVNDNPDPTVAEGGTHWSLLVYNRGSNEFVHHDSLNGANSWCARRLYEAVKGFVGCDGESARFVEARTPQQRNGYDCGLFVMAIARAVCECKEAEGEGEGEENWFGAVEAMDAERVGRLRGEVLELITRLMERK